MKNLERFKAAVEKFGYDQKEYTDNGFGTENLIFVGDIERAVLFMQHEHGDDDFEWHPGRVRINADSAVIKREYMSVEEDDTETCRTWYVTSAEVRHIFAAKTKEDFETRIQAYVAVNLALERYKDDPA